MLPSCVCEIYSYASDTGAPVRFDTEPFMSQAGASHLICIVTLLLVIRAPFGYYVIAAKNSKPLTGLCVGILRYWGAKSMYSSWESVGAHARISTN